MRAISRLLSIAILVGLCLAPLALLPVASVSAEGYPYDLTRKARVYSFVDYFGRSFSHHRVQDEACGTYVVFVYAQPINLDTNYAGTPDNWVARIGYVGVYVGVTSGSMRMGNITAWSPLGYWEDNSVSGLWITAGRFVPLLFDGGNFPFAIPTIDTYDNAFLLVTYSGASFTYAASRGDYMLPVRDYTPDPFTDVSNSSLEAYPTSVLYSQGITFGIGGGLYAPTQPVPRWQMASFIARAMGWQNEEWWDYTFTDIGGLSYETQRHIRALAHYGVTRGYDAAGCAALGKTHPCFVPEANISHIQTLAFISRANVAKGYWYWFPANSSLYPDVPSVHRQDVTAYVYNSGGAPDTTVFANWPWSTNATNRGWYARALWQSLP
jgi:hypothetical protein